MLYNIILPTWLMFIRVWQMFSDYQHNDIVTRWFDDVIGLRGGLVYTPISGVIGFPNEFILFILYAICICLSHVSNNCSITV